MGALLLAQLMNTIHEVLVDELQVTTMERHYKVDSIATLCWIQSCHPWKQFVRHRVQQVRELSSKEALGVLSKVVESSRFTFKGTVWEGPFTKHILVERPRVPTIVS